jgi:hypothetical protein
MFSLKVGYPRKFAYTEFLTPPPQRIVPRALHAAAATDCARASARLDVDVDHGTAGLVIELDLSVDKSGYRVDAT